MGAEINFHRFPARREAPNPRTRNPMKLKSTLTLALVFSATTSLLLAGPPRGGGRGPGGRPGGGPQGAPPISQALLQQYDTDGDGVLSDTEKAALKAALEVQRQALITKYDADGDGVLNEAERAAMQAELQAAKLAELAAKFVTLDTDASGGLSLEEFTAGAPTGASAARIQAAFTRMDANTDGSISVEEFTTPPAPPTPRHGRKPGAGTGTGTGGSSGSSSSSASSARVSL